MLDGVVCSNFGQKDPLTLLGSETSSKPDSPKNTSVSLAKGLPSMAEPITGRVGEGPLWTNGLGPNIIGLK